MAKDRAESRRAQFARLAIPPAIAAAPGRLQLSHVMMGLPAAMHALALRVAADVLRASHLVSDHHRNALMLAVLGFKVGSSGRCWMVVERWL